MASVDCRGFWPGKLWPDGRARGGAMRRTAPEWGLAQFGREVFCPWRLLEVVKPWQARTFALAAAKLAASMTLKS